MVDVSTGLLLVRLEEAELARPGSLFHQRPSVAPLLARLGRGGLAALVVLVVWVDVVVRLLLRLREDLLPVLGRLLGEVRRRRGAARHDGHREVPGLHEARICGRVESAMES